MCACNVIQTGSSDNGIIRYVIKTDFVYLVFSLISLIIIWTGQYNEASLATKYSYAKFGVNSSMETYKKRDIEFVIP